MSLQIGDIVTIYYTELNRVIHSSLSKWAAGGKFEVIYIGYPHLYSNSENMIYIRALEPHNNIYGADVPLGEVQWVYSRFLFKCGDLKPKRFYQNSRFGKFIRELEK